MIPRLENVEAKAFCFGPLREPKFPADSVLGRTRLLHSYPIATSVILQWSSLHSSPVPKVGAAIVVVNMFNLGD